jgi:hypothetical protein
MTAREWLDSADELERLAADVRENPGFPECQSALLERIDAIVASIRERFASEQN